MRLSYWRYKLVSSLYFVIKIFVLCRAPKDLMPVSRLSWSSLCSDPRSHLYPAILGGLSLVFYQITLSPWRYIVINTNFCLQIQVFASLKKHICNLCVIFQQSFSCSHFWDVLTWPKTLSNRYLSAVHLDVFWSSSVSVMEACKSCLKPFVSGHFLCTDVKSSSSSHIV